MAHGLEAPYRLDVDSDVPERRSFFKARSGEGLVFLDLDSDEYSCCYNYENPIEEYFLIAGLQSDTRAYQKLPIAAADWMESPRCDSLRISAIDVARFSSALITAYRRFRGRTIRDLLEVAQALASGCSNSQATKSEIAHIFDALLTMLPVQPECLFRSFCLLHFLDRYGHRADWVFGVQLFPFRAHCWVACGNELLNERPHAIEDYEVIHIAAQAEG